MGFWRKVAITLGFAGMLAGTRPQQTTAQQTQSQEQREDYPTRLNRIMQLEGVRNPGMFSNIYGYAILKNAVPLVQEIALRKYGSMDANNVIRVIKELKGDQQGGVLMRDARETFRVLAASRN